MLGYDNFQTKVENGEGLKVLLIDEDINWLMYMSSVLEEHSYKVTKTKLAFMGLSMILESCIDFDLIICEIDMPGMDGFEFLKQITSKADIPILLISASEDIELLRKSLKEGACFFFHKPIAKHTLVNIWQYVVRYTSEKNPLMQGLMQRDMEKYFENLHGKGKSSFLGKMEYSNFLDMKNPGVTGASTTFNESQSSSNNENGNHTRGNFQLGKRRREEDGMISSSSSASAALGGGNQNEEKQKVKTSRLNWTTELQQKFKDAYEALGETRATPAKIKELMNEPKLTPQHISSYLQKFRARIKTQKEVPTEAVTEKAMHGSVPRAGTCLDGYPTLSLNSSRAPYQFNRQPNIPRPNLVPNGMPNYRNTSGNLLHNASLYNFRANTSNNFTNIFGQRIQGNICPGLQPLEPISETGAFHNNISLRQFLPERNPPALMQEMNLGLGMGGGNTRARESVPRGIGIARMQQRNGGLGLVRMSQELTPEEIDNLLQHFPGNHSRKDASSPEGNVSASSVTQPLTPHIRTATAEERDTDETSSDDEVEEDMGKFLNMDEFSANSDADDGFIMP